MANIVRRYCTIVTKFDSEGKIISSFVENAPLCAYCNTEIIDGELIKIGKKRYHKYCYGLEVTA